MSRPQPTQAELLPRWARSRGGLEEDDGPVAVEDDPALAVPPDGDPVRTSPAELLDRVGKEAAAYNAARFGTEPDVVPHPQGSTPGSSATRVTPEEMGEIRRRQQEADEA